jgi:dihydroflavonol-4-reductase
LAEGDVTDPASLRACMEGSEWLVHLANFYEFWAPDPNLYEAVNVGGTRNVLEAARRAGVSKIVHVSTMAVYCDASWPISEETPLGPHCWGHYSRTKRAGDAVAWELYDKERIPLVVVYPGGVLGPNDPKASGRYIHNLVDRKMPAQVCTDNPLPWVSVDDVAEGIALALEKEGNTGERYCLVSECLTMGEINAMVAELARVRLPLFKLPDWLTLVNAYLATGLANLTGRPPMLDMALEQVYLMCQGMRADGSKAARELGLAYTPIREVIKQILASLPPAHPKPVYEEERGARAFTTESREK